MFAIDFSNPWVASVDAARRKAPAWLVYVAALGLAAGVVAVGGRAAEAVQSALAPPAGAPAPSWLAAWDLIGSDLFVFLPLTLVAVGGLLAEGRTVVPAIARPLANLGFGALGGASAFAVALALAALAGSVTVGAGGLVGTRALGGAAAGAVLIAVQAGAEEIYFRGWLQPIVCARWGPWLGGAATAAAFAALHLLAAVGSPLALANTFLAGLALGLLALRTGGLMASIAAHTAWNWTESFGLGTDPNPGVGPLGALADLDLGGRALWSGGSEAMNGSLATTVVLAAVTVALVAAPSQRAKTVKLQARAEAR